MKYWSIEEFSKFINFMNTQNSEIAYRIKIFTLIELYLGDRIGETRALTWSSINEELVGEALKPYKNNVIIATKFGLETDKKVLTPNSKPEVIRKSIDGSLKRLQLETIDLYYLHRVDTNTPIEEVASTIKDLIKDKNSWFYLSNEQVNKLMKKSDKKKDRHRPHCGIKSILKP
mgnify:CR=1 FL=1